MKKILLSLAILPMIFAINIASTNEANASSSLYSASGGGCRVLFGLTTPQGKHHTIKAYYYTRYSKRGTKAAHMKANQAQCNERLAYLMNRLSKYNRISWRYAISTVNSFRR